MEVYTHIENKIKELGESCIYINSYNDDHDNIVNIRYFDSHISTQISFGKKVEVRHIGLQIYVRDISFEAGYARCESIRSLFAAYGYQCITIIQKGDILTLGNDDKSRSEFTINFDMKLIGGSTISVISVIVNSVVANVNVSMIAPTTAINQQTVNILVPIANVNVSAIRPIIAISTSVLQKVANVSVSMLAPTIVTGISINAVVANVGVLALSPNISIIQNANINALVANTSVSMVNPIVAIVINTNTNVPVANINVSALSPTISSDLNININALVTNINVSAVNPVIAIVQDASVSVPVVDTSVNAINPTISIVAGVNIIVNVANISVSAVNPSIMISETVIVPVSNINVNAQSPSVTITQNINIDVTGVNTDVSMIAPVISIGNVINALVANVGINAVNPTIAISSSVTVPVTNVNISAIAPSIGTGFTGLFDTLNNVANAVCVFSPYKKTTSTYNGYAVNVKRSSDLTAQDFGFNADGTIDSAAILAFCGSGDGVATKVYLQTNGTYAYQNTYNNCPKIVSSGTFLTDGLLFDGSNDYLTIDDYTQIQMIDPPLSIYVNYKDNNLSQGSMVFWKNTGGYAQSFGIYKTSTYTRVIPPDTDYAKVETNVKLMTCWKSKSTNGCALYYNNYSVSNTTRSASLESHPYLNLACRSSAVDNSTHNSYFNGNIKSFVIFNNNEESNLTAIKAAL